MEFKCAGVNVSFLLWLRNGTNIGVPFIGIPNEPAVQWLDLFTLFLDSNTRREGRVNMTSRLVGNLSNFISGDRITCATAINTNNTVTLNYRLRGK